MHFSRLLASAALVQAWSEMGSVLLRTSLHQGRVNGSLVNYLVPSAEVPKNKEEELEMSLELYEVIVHKVELTRGIEHYVKAV